MMSDELRPEYNFDYRKAKANRFAHSLPTGGKVVYLEPDVAAKFADSETVNHVLRTLIDDSPAQAFSAPVL
jgi:hypothetical protein